jgi:hypothetical protein
LRHEAWVKVDDILRANSGLTFQAAAILAGRTKQAFISNKVKVALVRQRFRNGDVLSGGRVVQGMGNDGAIVCVVVGRRDEHCHVCRD